MVCHKTPLELDSQLMSFIVCQQLSVVPLVEHLSCRELKLLCLFLFDWILVQVGTSLQTAILHSLFRRFSSDEELIMDGMSE